MRKHYTTPNVRLMQCSCMDVLTSSLDAFVGDMNWQDTLPW